MHTQYDCIVCGAGPGGSWAAKAAAENGLRTLLLEKDREIGVPVRCAEGVGEAGLKSVVEPQERWIANVLTGAVLIAPNGQEVVVEGNGERGLVLDRKIFDYELAVMAAAKGAEIKTKAYVFDLLKENGHVCGVKYKHLGKEIEARAGVVIGADGVESRVGRFAGLHTALKLKDIESCIQVTLANIKIDPRYIYVYFGQDIAPGGYLWIFPKNENLANVGLGISGTNARQRAAMHYLEVFLKWRFPKASRVCTVVGGVPVAASLKKIVTNALMLVGDAAHQVNPVTGGGIVTAMQAGRLAGQVAAEAVKVGDFSEELLSKYADAWHKLEGKNHERFYRVKEAMLRFTDHDLNRTAEIIAKLPSGKRTLLNIFKNALTRHPSLLFDITKAFIR
ncbi:MAG: NAD(P)/FAD-dependent oxidoreductase [bacterium]